MEYKGIPKGNPYWALVLGFSVAVAALFFGLWLISPRELAKFKRSQPATVPTSPSAPAARSIPQPPPPPALPDFLDAQ